MLEQKQERYGAPAGSGTGAPSGSDIGAQAAQQAALAHAGVSAADTYELKVERDWDDGRLEYEVEFKSGGYEYEYKISGADGSVLEFERDWD